MLADRDPTSNTDTTPLEIERVFLLDRLPDLPPHAQAYRIEQGYLPDDDGAPEGPFAEGRLRKKTAPDGTVTCFHTIKSGAGLVREEVERSLTEAELAEAWPRTAGRRLKKTRYEVAEGALTWEVDAFDDWPLVMAEVELPRADAEAPLPAWLAGHVVRELTDDPRYRNYALATEGPPAGSS